MAKIVIAGVANCPRFAQAELLADQLASNLPNFQLHKITKLPHEWQNWLTSTCQSRGWSYSKSPIVWRELVDRGGKGLLIGGANEFQEYVASYYGITSDMKSKLARKIGAENLITADQLDSEDRARKESIKPTKVCITSAASQLGYEFVSRISSGEVFGRDTVVSLRLLDDDVDHLKGITMEAVDMASGVIHETKVSDDATSLFSECDVIVLLDRITQDDDETRNDWLQRVNYRYSAYASDIDKLASSDVRVILAGVGPAANFAGAIFSRNAPNIPPSNVVVAVSPSESRARGAIARHVGVNSASIVDLIVWGDAAAGNFNRFTVDASLARIYDIEKSAVWGPEHSVPVPEVVHNDAWIQIDLPKMIASAPPDQNKRSLAMTTADAVSSLLYDWYSGHDRHRIHSLAVCSEGWFGIPKGLYFSVPVRFSGAKAYTVATDVVPPSIVRERFSDIIQELEADVEVIYPNPNRHQRLKTPRVTFVVHEAEPSSPTPVDAAETDEPAIASNTAAEADHEIVPDDSDDMQAPADIDDEEDAEKLEKISEDGEQDNGADTD